MKKLLLLSALLIFTCSSDDSNNDNDNNNSEFLNCDGNPIPTIVYGTQEWTVENACHITYRDGTLIPEVIDSALWSDITTGAWSYYNSDPTKGKLYNWYAVMGIHDNDPNTPNKEFAPEGWHVPTDAEWTTLEEHLISNGYNYDQTNTGNKIAKAMASTTGWNSSTSTILGAICNDQNLNNSSGFNAFPKGWRLSGGLFSAEGADAIFWSSTEKYYRSLFFGNSYVHRGSLNFSFDGSEQDGFSVRFVRD